MKKQTLKNSLLQKKRISRLQQTKIVGGGTNTKTKATRDNKCDFI